MLRNSSNRVGLNGSLGRTMLFMWSGEGLDLVSHLVQPVLDHIADAHKVGGGYQVSASAQPVGVFVPTSLRLTAWRGAQPTVCLVARRPRAGRRRPRARAR